MYKKLSKVNENLKKKKERERERENQTGMLEMKN
jgi:hypothetical protein